MRLRDLGITAIQLMPLAQFPGRRSWGYDGMYWYAVQNTYGGPRELQHLVNACHRSGLSLFLDVAYSRVETGSGHLSEFGPYVLAGNRIREGYPINYDGPGCEGVRCFVLNNVRQWVRDFHVDGFRLNSTYAIQDQTVPHIVVDIKTAASEEGTKLHKPVHFLAESNLNDLKNLLHRGEQGHGLDAQVNDDFHHCVQTLVTPERDGCYQDFRLPLSQLTKVINCVFAYDGNFSDLRGTHHGVPVGDLPGDRFVVSIQSHAHVGKRVSGDRLAKCVSYNRLRISAAIMLLSPFLPSLFMGEEYGETSPFPFFCDVEDVRLTESARSSRDGEVAPRKFEVRALDPLSESTFEKAMLQWDWSKCPWKAGLRQLYCDLISARSRWAALRDTRHREAHLVFAAKGESVLKFVRGDPATPHEQLEIYFNPRETTVIMPSMTGLQSQILLSTEDVKYGGWKRPKRRCLHLSPFECLVIGRESSPVT